MGDYLSLEPVASQEESAKRPLAFDRSLVREVVALLVMTAVADVTIYRARGYSGPAVFLTLAPLVFLIGKSIRGAKYASGLIFVMLLALSARLVWCGSPLQLFVGFAWLVAFTAALAGRVPYLQVVLAMGAQSIIAGGRTLTDYFLTASRLSRYFRHRSSVNILLPAAAFLVFSKLFVLANPDAVTFITDQLEALKRLSDWFIRTVTRPTEVAFWVAVIWLTAGLLRPLVPVSQATAESEVDQSEVVVKTPLFAAYRNTLVTVIVLFAGYLVYEFYSLWNRDFPEGFYYAGYAHQGAAWLTVALALATATLSLVFSRNVLSDSRLPTLRRLAWVWSLQNFLLALSVYNRLFIYIDFNGMTHMRIVGLFGTTLVVVGFLLVVWKISGKKTFAWLIHRQIWAFCIAVYLYALCPVDWMAATYNVDRILKGDISACMQIGVQPLDLEGVLALTPLLDSSIPEIREGVTAIIAGQYLDLQEEQKDSKRRGWTAYQASTEWAIARLEPYRDQLRRFFPFDVRLEAQDRFYSFAYRWY